MHCSSESQPTLALSVLDDSEVILMWHAILATLFKNPREEVFNPPISLGHLLSQPIESYVDKIEQGNNPKVETNKYFQVLSALLQSSSYNGSSNLQPSRMQNKSSPLADNVSAAVVYHGSSIFGEWQTMFIENGEKESLIPVSYLRRTFFLTMISRSIGLVPSDILYKYLKHIYKNTSKKKRTTPLIISYNLESNDGKDKLNCPKPKLKGNWLTEKILCGESRSEENVLQITYNSQFRDILLKDVNDKLEILNHIKNMTDKYAKKTFIDVIEDMRILNDNVAGFERLFVDEDIRKQIREILEPAYLGTKSESELDGNNKVFFQMMQFLMLFIKFESLDGGLHYHFPRTLLAQTSSNVPIVFFTFYGNIARKEIASHLNAIDKIYEKFCNRYLGYVQKIIQETNRETLNKFFPENNKKEHETELEVYQANHNLIEKMKSWNSKLLLSNILMTQHLVKEFMSETRIESTDIQYSFFLSNKENNELIQRKYGTDNSFDLMYVDENEILDFFTVDDPYQIVSHDDENLLNRKEIYQIMGLLKGQYTFINKPNRIIGLIPNSKGNLGIKFYNILDLDQNKIGFENYRGNNIEILKAITSNFLGIRTTDVEEIVGFAISNKNFHIINNGEIVLSYNRKSLKWEYNFEIRTLVRKMLINYLNSSPPDIDLISEIIGSSIEQITSSQKYGASFILVECSDDLRQHISETVNVSKYSPLEIKPVNSEANMLKREKQRIISNLADLAIMDGATIIDITNWKAFGRVILHPMMEDPENRPAKIPFQFSLNQKKLTNLDPDWPERSKYLSQGTRHISALGMACCVNSLIFTVSSTGALTIFFRKKDGQDYKVRGYSIEDFHELIEKTEYDDYKEVKKYLKVNETPLKGKVAEKLRELLPTSMIRHSILDLGCGNGYYTRFMKDEGAKYVMGIDSSHNQIELAKQVNGSRTNLDFEIGDAKKLVAHIRSIESNKGPVGPFDTVTALFLFHHIESREGLEHVANGIYDILNEGGELISIIVNPSIDLTSFDKNKYGRNITSLKNKRNTKLNDDDRFSVEFLDECGQPLFETVGINWSQKTYEKIFKDVGFNIRWIPPDESNSYFIAFKCNKQ